MIHTRRSQFIRWEQVKGPKAHIALIIATGLGSGLFPVAPGTMGSLMALPICYLGQFWNPWVYFLVWFVIFIVGLWATKTLDELTHTRDNSSIVIDEFLGMALSTIPAMGHPSLFIAAFVYFRFFDILKIPPVKQLDKLSKRGGAWRSAFFVIADDLGAGIQAALVLYFTKDYILNFINHVG